MAQVRRDRTDQLDRRDHVGVDLAADLLVGEFLGQANQAVAGVGNDDVDPSELGERSVDHGAQLRGVGDVELGAPELIAVAVGQVVESRGTAQRRGDSIAALEQDLGHLAAETAGGAGDEPGLGH